MSRLSLGSNDELYYLHQPPDQPQGLTFVFFNALTGDTSNWEAVIAPRLRQAGHGTLCYDYRGQGQSTFSPDAKLTTQSVVTDAVTLLNETDPQRPVMVGLSIGGLFAARAFLEGVSAEAMVLINTLRKAGPRLSWIGDALVRAVSVGGLDLFRDLFLPLLVNDEWQAQHRGDFIKEPANYAPLAAESGIFKLLAEAGRDADWTVPYEQLTMPTLVITGLQDHVFLEPDVVNALVERLPQATRLDMADAGHLIPAERPDALADALIQFGKEVL